MRKWLSFSLCQKLIVFQLFEECRHRSGSPGFLHIVFCQQRCNQILLAGFLA